MQYIAYFSISGENKISIYQMDPDTGDLSLLSHVTVDGTPAPLVVDSEQAYLYAGLRSTEQIAVFEINQSDGQLTQIGQTKIQSNSCYITLDQSDNFLLSAYYGAGCVSVHQIGNDKLVVADPISWIETAEHAHCVMTDPTNRYAFVPHTVEPNMICQFLFNQNTGKLMPNTVPKVIPADGEGPRHYCHHPNKDVLYFSNEQGSSVTAYHLDADIGTLSPFQTLSTLPDDFDGPNTCAQIHLDPTGEFLYVSNRGHDSIAIFAVNQSNGQLITVGQQPSEPTPRTFDVDPTGNFLFAGGQGSGKLATYRIDRQKGSLSPLKMYEVGQTPSWVMVLEFDV